MFNRYTKEPRDRAGAMAGAREINVGAAIVSTPDEN